jgi:predicted 2-oxoglutarate/Fe(II)-dependent dioxygenase YbiX
MSDLSTPKHGLHGGFSLTQEDVEKFLAITKKIKPKKGKVFQSKKKVANKEYRDVDVYYIEAEEEELYKILQSVALKINEHFKYKIDGIEKAQVMKYTAPSNGYGWHIDMGAEGISANRKIGVSILLNNDYEGGELSFRTGEETKTVKPDTGEVVAFSSFVPHKVEKITKGERLVLVVWFTGPHFR